MFQFNYKLKVSERVKAKCDRHPRYNPETRGARRHQGWMLDLLLSLRSASGEAIARRRLPGVSEKRITVDAASSAPRQVTLGEAGRTTFERGKPLSRRVALAAVWLCIRPRKADGGGPFPPRHPSHGEIHWKGDVDGQDRIHSSQYAHGY